MATNNGSNCGISYEEEEDRLSSLPDCLLVEILLLLPFNSAVATSVLSRRWSLLWTHHTHLLLEFNPYKADFSEFAATVDRILRQLALPKLHSFTLLLHTHLIVGSEIDHLRSLISEVCARSPECIRIGASQYCGVPPFVTLPGCVINCHSLVELSLRGTAQIDPPRDGCLINLPNLKKLEMSVSDHEFDFAGTLVKSCPLLEHLYLRLFPLDNAEQHSVDIVAPRLKYLHTHVVHCKAYLKVVIDTPMLQHLTVEGNLAFYRFVNTPAALLTAQLSFDDTAIYGAHGDYCDYLNRISGLVPEISGAMTVVLSRYTVHLLSYLCYGTDNAMPVFRNLSKLQLEIDSRLWNFWSPIPACFLSTVEKIKISGAFVVDDCYLLWLEYILRNAMVLKELVVSVPSYKGSGDPLRPLCEEYKFCKKLFMLPRSSSGCQIHVLGSCVTASSDGFKNGSLACQINTLD